VAVAEAWVHPNRRPPYASEEGLGQAFNFDLLASGWDPKQFRDVIDDNLEMSAKTGSSSTWVMSNHDVIRHATRLVIPGYGSTQDSFDLESAWYQKHRLDHDLDLDKGLQRAKAATLLMLALPGSSYLYQGEELGLHDVTDIPSDQMQDPQWFRGEGKLKSRDGCRVPLPWEPSGPSFGFGPGGAHLPQPSWFANVAASVQESDSGSTLNLYRQAIALRKQLYTSDELKWLELPTGQLGFSRSSNWFVVANFSDEPVQLSGNVLLSSAKVVDGLLLGNSTAWLSSL
jgi:alpha-glucosidase